MKHTQHRLRAGRNGAFGTGSIDTIYTAETEISGELIASLKTSPPNPNAEADAMRLVECWNACYGISDPENFIARLRVLNSKQLDTEATYARLRVQNDVLLDTMKQVKKMIDEALPKFNWAKSTLDANAINLLNQVPVAVKSAIIMATEPTSSNIESLIT